MREMIYDEIFLDKLQKLFDCMMYMNQCVFCDEEMLIIASFSPETIPSFCDRAI